MRRCPVAAIGFVVGVASIVLLGQSQVEVNFRVGHLNEVTAIAFSADSRTLATGGQSGVVKLWDSDNGLLLGAIDSGTTVDALHFSADGTLLATAARDVEAVHQITEGSGGVKMWDVQSGKQRYSLAGPQLPAAPRLGQRRVEFLDDGRAALVWGENSGARIDVATGERGWELAGTLQAVSRDKRIAVAVGQERTAVYDLASGGLITTLNARPSAQDGPLGKVQACVPADGSWVAIPAVTSRGANVSVFDATTGRQRWTRDATSAEFAAVLCAPSGDTVVALFASGNTWRRDVLVLDTSNGEERGRFVIGDVQIRDSSISNDGRTLAIISADQRGLRTEVALWDTSTGMRRQLGATVETPSIGINRAGFSPDGRLVAVTGPVGEVQLFERETGRQRWRVGPASEPDSLFLSRDGSRLVAIREFGARVVNVWNAATGTRLFSAQFKGAVDIAPLDDGQTILVARVEGLEAWDLATKRVRWRSEAFGDMLVVSADGSAAALIDSYLDHRTVRVYDASTGRVRCTTKSDRPIALPAVALSPDGALVALVNKSGISILDARTCRRQRTIADTADADRLTWSPDGAVLLSQHGQLSGATDRTSYWDTRSGQLLRTEGPHRTVVFSRDGKHIVRRSHDGNFEIAETTSGRTTMVLRHPAFRSYQPFPSPFAFASPAAALSSDATTVWTARQGELHRWTAADGQLRATLAVLPVPDDGTGGEWVAFTPDGYWHGSAGAERHLNWRIDGRATQAAAIAERFRVPDRVFRALSGRP